MKNIIEEMLINKHSKESIIEELNRLLREEIKSENPIVNIQTVNANNSVPQNLVGREIIGISKVKYRSVTNVNVGYSSNGEVKIAPQELEEERLEVVYGIRRNSVISDIFDDHKNLKNEIKELQDKTKTAEKNLQEHINKLTYANNSIERLETNLKDSQDSYSKERDRRYKIENDIAKLKSAIGELKFKEIIGE